MRFLMCIMALGFFGMAQAQVKPVKNGKELSSRQIVEYLASDSLEGRFPGSRGDSLVRSFIAGRMEELGLEPCFETPDGKKTYFQPFELIISRKVEGENFLRIGKDPVRETEMEPGADYYPASFSGNGRFSGPAVGIGYGLQINAGPGRTDDYRDIDVKGKCVVITAGLPPRLASIVNEKSGTKISGAENNGSGEETKPGTMPSRMTEEIRALGNARNKALVAQDRGAAAVILITSSAAEETVRGVAEASVMKTTAERKTAESTASIRRRTSKGGTKATAARKTTAGKTSAFGAATIEATEASITEKAADATAASERAISAGAATVMTEAATARTAAEAVAEEEETGPGEDLVWTASRDFPLNIPVVKISRETAEKMFPELIAAEEAVGKGIHTVNNEDKERNKNIKNKENSGNREEKGEGQRERKGEKESKSKGGGENIRVQLCVSIRQVAVNTCNIAGMVPGRTDEYIVIGAHYDHLGYGGSGSGSRQPDTKAVHPGADDNASGIAGMLSLAQKYSGTVPEKGLIFAAFGAEEEGVVGSKYFADHLPVPREKMKAMFNFDMIGNLRGSALSVGGTGTAVQTDSLLRVASRIMPGLKIKSSPEGHGPSDHAPFYAKKLPVFYFTSGGTLDYHTPRDKADKLNYAGLDSVAAFAGVLLEEAMKLPRGLSFREAGSPKASPMRGGFKVTLGLMPDVTGSSNDGLRAEVVIKGKPADRAGMKSGDVIIEINGLSVSNIEDYMTRLGTLRAGKTARVKVRRDGKVLPLEIRL